MTSTCDWRRSVSIVICVITSLSTCAISEADQQIYFQDFESGLGANESTTGVWDINNTNVNNNSTLMMGHPTAYASNDHSTYELVVNLSNFAQATMTFDFLADLEPALMAENRPDGFALRANPIEDSPPPDVISPTAASDMQYVFHPPAVNSPFHQFIGPDYYDESPEAGGSSGTAEYDLDAFTGAVLTLRFQFNSDNSVHANGFNLDNLEIRGVLDDADLMGDGNADGWVDGLDYLLWAGSFGSHPGPGGEIAGDYNEDGWVDGLDYLLWADNFGTHVSTAVPEPSSLLLAGAGLLAMFCRPREDDRQRSMVR